jgi:hypothetical protein
VYRFRNRLSYIEKLKEDGHETQEEDKKERNLLLSSGIKLTKMDIK